MPNRTPSGHALPAVIVLAWVSASPLAGQAMVVAINRNGEALDSTAEVLRTPFASVMRQPLHLGDTLAVDDELRSGGTVVVELRCGSGARVVLSERFRVLVQPGRPGVECVFRLSSGTVDVQSEQPTDVDFAEAGLSSRRTQYAVRIEEPGGESPYRVTVFDDSVTVRTAAGAVRSVAAGQTMVRRNRRLATMAVSQPDIDRTALAFAQADVAPVRLAPRTAREAQARLMREYAAVLAAPTDARARTQLAATQLQLQVAPTMSLYHLKRAPLTDRASRATVGYLTGVAYSRSGDTASANREFRTATRTDSAAVEQVIRNYRLESTAYRATLMVRPRVTRPDSTPGEPPRRE